mmetsp:Transcript_3036/g.7709  ORF Transcript_3036/g.7709 Transcript_3036/m.7709 type:complete len:315 (+) Transcript_3036:190-1134(+)
MSRTVSNGTCRAKMPSSRAQPWLTHDHCAVEVLDEDAVALVTRHVGDDDVLCFALTCRAFLRALRRGKRWRSGSLLQTQRGAAVLTPTRLAWALESFGGAVDPSGTRLCALAAGRGALDTLRALHLCQEPWGNALECAAGGGHLEVALWLIDQGCLFSERVCAAAAWRGHLGVLRLARDRGCPWDAETCACAAHGGHLEVLQWARAHGCPWDRETCRQAAAGGHLAVLAWARQSGCPWGMDTPLSAALEGHLSVLQWALAHRCAWDSFQCRLAAQAGGHVHVVRWITVALSNGVHHTSDERQGDDDEDDSAQYY